MYMYVPTPNSNIILPATLYVIPPVVLCAYHARWYATSGVVRLIALSLY